MAIKDDAARYFVGLNEERDLAQYLGEAFDITFRSTWSDLSFWLAEPQDLTRERFGLQQEVLVVYSKHRRTDARVLTAIENITRSPDFKHRVEKVLFFLIHKGTDQEAQALVESSVDRIIIPIRVEELQNPVKGNVFIRSRIAAAIGTVDLFGMTSAITSDKYFFGRNELVQSLINRSTISKENSGLFGLRKTGKTSVLRAIQRRIEDRPILVEYIECSNPGIHSARWWQVLENITERCISILKRYFDIKCDFRRGYTQNNAGNRFMLDIQDILQEGKIDQIMLMLDEVEFITYGLSGTLGQHWDQDFVPFWQTIRSIHQESQGKLVFIVAGVNPASVETSHFSGIQNPIFQLAAPHYLEPFSTAQVREMVRSIGKYAGIRFQEEVYYYLQSTYGGHPFLTRIACSEVWKVSDKLDPERLTQINIRSFQMIQQEIRSRLTAPIKDILLSLVWWYPEEYDLLRILAAGDADFVSDYLRHEPRSIFRFAQYGILKKNSNGEFAIADLRDFLNSYGESYKKEISPFARGDMPPELLPEVPDLVTVGRLFEKRSEVEIKIRKIIMMYLNVKCNFDSKQIAQHMLKGISRRSDRPDPKDLFVGRSAQEVVNQLYIPDLKGVIKANWDVFGALFDNKEQRFEMNMDTLNIARRVDAHTKPVTSQEANEFENSYSWILGKIKKIPL